MNATQFVRQQVAEARGLTDAAMAGLTDEQFNDRRPAAWRRVRITLAGRQAAVCCFHVGGFMRSD